MLPLELQDRNYVLLYRMFGEPVNTAHLVLVNTVKEARKVLRPDRKKVQWASVCNDSYQELYPLGALI